MIDGITFDLDLAGDRARFRDLCQSRLSDPLHVGGFAAELDDSLAGVTVRVEGARARFSPRAFLSFLAHAHRNGIRHTTTESN